MSRSRRRKRRRERSLRIHLVVDSMLDVDSYLSDPRPSCPACNVPSDTVETRLDPFWCEGICWQDGPRHMTTCLACYDERRMDI